MMGLGLGAIAFIFLLWDTPRLLTLPYFWFGIVLGSLPLSLWYSAQWFHYGDLLSRNLVNQSFQRIWTGVEQNQNPPWFYLLEMVKYGMPWILFLPLGGRLAWVNRNLSWAKLAIAWAGVYFVLISVMVTKLPWYILPLYPALALLAGAQLATFWRGGRHDAIKQFWVKRYSPVWVGWFVGLGLAAGVGIVYFQWMSGGSELDVQWVLAAFGLTMLATATLMARQNPQFVAVLLWGTYLSLMLFVTSNNWVWELAEHYPVKPVSAIIQRHVPMGQKVYTSAVDSRPSLSFYSEREVVPRSEAQIKKLWKGEVPPFLLLDDGAILSETAKPNTSLKLKKTEVLGRAEGWILVTKAGKG
jgi:4-amino-4-deoxy-L-arabinose transferase-like glycosyltransferase